MERFLRERYGRYYIYEKELLPYETIIVELPLILSKHFHYDMGIASSGKNVSFFVTYSINPEKPTAVWTEIADSHSYKAARAIKASNQSRKKQNICLRIAF